jgi:hypothetical protein
MAVRYNPGSYFYELRQSYLMDDDSPDVLAYNTKKLEGIPRRSDNVRSKITTIWDFIDQNFTCGCPCHITTFEHCDGCHPDTRYPPEINE